jgi:hypothetical protein
MAGCLDLESPPPPPPPDNPGTPDAGVVIDEPDAEPLPVDALAQWSGCMTIANWDTALMGAWANKPTEGGTVCSSCHGDGLARFHTDVDNNAMFQMNRYEVFISGFFTQTVGPSGIEVVPAVEKLRLKGGGAGDHPTYNTSPSDPYFLALDQFHQLTLGVKQAGTCGPAEFPP